MPASYALYADPGDVLALNLVNHRPAPRGKSIVVSGGGDVVVDAIVRSATLWHQHPATYALVKSENRYTDADMRRLTSSGWLVQFHGPTEAQRWWVPGNSVVVPAFGGSLAAGPKRCTPR